MDEKHHTPPPNRRPLPDPPAAAVVVNLPRDPPHELPPGTPTTGGDVADRALALTLNKWLTKPHTWGNKHAADAVRRWITAKNL